MKTTTRARIPAFPLQHIVIRHLGRTKVRFWPISVAQALRNTQTARPRAVESSQLGVVSFTIFINLTVDPELTR